MRRSLVPALVMAVLVVAVAGMAAAQQAASPSAAPADPARGIVCGEPYAVRRGDTLQRLAARVYGPDATYHALWAANRERLGLRDPSLIEIGQIIIAPCPVEVGPVEAVPGEAVPVEAVPSEAGPVEAGPVEAAGADRATVAGSAAPAPAPPVAQSPEPKPALTVLDLGGPALTRKIALAALSQTLGAEAFALVDASERAGEGESASVGLRFPLVRPDCAAPDALNADALRLCRDLAWSAPLLEQALVWHARAQPLAPRAVAAVRVCRADSAPRAALGPLFADVSMARDVSVFDGGDALACLSAVAEGRADFAVAEAADADAALRDAALAAAIVEQPGLTRLAALRAAAPRDDAEARALLAALELGLARLRASGAWFAMVDAALAENARAP